MSTHCAKLCLTNFGKTGMIFPSLTKILRGARFSEKCPRIQSPREVARFFEKNKVRESVLVRVCTRFYHSFSSLSLTNGGPTKFRKNEVRAFGEGTYPLEPFVVRVQKGVSRDPLPRSKGIIDRKAQWNLSHWAFLTNSFSTHKFFRIVAQRQR
jgi:hypothetical protein